jgi:predicted transcriptional regulator
MSNPTESAPNTTAPVFLTPDDLPHRVREIATLRGLGYSFREIAEQLNVTPQAVSLMLSRHRRSLKSLNGSLELRNLSARAVNALGRHGVASRQQARDMDVLQRLRGERNCGRKTIDEIARWLAEPDHGAPLPDEAAATT